MSCDIEENLRRSVGAVFQKPSGTEKITDKKEKYHDFPLKFFRQTVRKRFKREPFCVSQKFRYRKMEIITDERGDKEERSRYSTETFCFTVLEIFEGEILGVSLFSRTEKFYS